MEGHGSLYFMGRNIILEKNFKILIVILELSQGIVDGAINATNIIHFSLSNYVIGYLRGLYLNETEVVFEQASLAKTMLIRM